MPLSEHEQRLLEQIEKSLIDDDPKFASTVRSTDLRAQAKKRIRLAVVLVVAGLGVLVGGVFVKVVLVGVLGFCIMFAGAAIVVTNYKNLSSTGAQASSGPPSKSRGKGRGAKRPSLKQRLEERFRRRFDQ